MATYGEEVRDLVFATLWSQWAELGLSGWERHHRDVAIDLEALIIVTARIGHRDTRLRNEALDWCVAHGRIASAIRLKHLTGDAAAPTQRAMHEFSATVNANSGLRWPDPGSPLGFTSAGRSEAPRPERPALIQLRLRALWGVSARAEALRVMLPESGRFMGISEVATRAAYGKDAIAEALDNLHRGGLLDATTSANQRVFLLGRRDDLVRLIGAQPALVTGWSVVFPIMAGILEATDVSETSPMARAARIQRLWRDWQPQLARLGIITNRFRPGLDFLDDFEDFTLRALRTWSGLEAATPAQA
jgi:hypothetical protein